VSVLDRFKDGMGIEEMVIGLLSTVASVGGGEAEAERVLQKLKDEYAHELAEKQRRFARETVGGGAVGAVCLRAIDGAADLIDPGGVEQ
jgi:hypothetical protein